MKIRVIFQTRKKINWEKIKINIGTFLVLLGFFIIFITASRSDADYYLHIPPEEHITITEIIIWGAIALLLIHFGAKLSKLIN